MIEKILQKNEEVINYFYFFTKNLMIMIASFLAFKIKISDIFFLEYLQLVLILIIVIVLLEISLYKKNRFYNKSLIFFLKNDLIQLFLSILVIIFIAAIFKVTDFYSRIWLFLFIIFSSTFLFLNKLFFNFFYKKIITSNILTKNILIIGNFEDCKNLIKLFNKDNRFHFRACIFMDNKKDAKYFPIQKISLDSTLGQKLIFYEIAQIWILHSENFNKINIMDKLNTIPIDIRNIYKSDMHKEHYIENIHGYNIYETSLSPFYGFNYLIKIIIDYLFGLLFLTISIPIILFFGLLIFIEDGKPIFFRQKRHGWDGRVINILKLRSLKISNSENQVKKEDKRVLKVGKFIRRFSIDELPQFINVLKGDMSIVGPRPHSTIHNDQFSQKIKGFMQRHRCKPGLTGLAQMKGYRGNIENKHQLQQRYEYDMLYIKKWSPILDLKIILQTMFKFLFQKAH